MSLREGRWALAVALAVHLLFLVSLSTQFLNPLFIEAERAYGQAGDYFGIYQAGDNLVHGKSVYDSQDYRNEAERRVPYFYFYRYLPPTAAVAALGTLFLSPWAGYWIWIVLTELLLALIVLWILRLEAYPACERRLHASLWIGFFPFYLEQWMGQFSFLMAFFLWILLRDGMPDRPAPARDAGPTGRSLAAWTASVALKSFPALFAISYLARRKIRPVVVCAAIVLLASVPYYLARPADLRQFVLLNFHPLPPRVHGGTLGASAFVRLLGWSLPDAIAGRLLDFRIFDVCAGNVPVLLMMLAVVVLTTWVAVARGRTVPLNLQVSLWLLAFFLIFKDVWEYHFVMLLPVVTAVGLASRSRFVLWMGLLLALPTPYALLARGGTLSPGADLLHHASKAIPTGLLYVWVFHRAIAPATDCRRATPSAPQPSSSPPAAAPHPSSLP